MTASAVGRPRPGTPLPVVLLAALGAGLFVVPLAALVWRTPWSRVIDELRAPATLDALRLSLVCSLSATAIALVLGTPLAWVLARRPFRGARLLRAALAVPMVLPPVVGGVALLMAFGRRGIIGGPLYDWFGWRIGFTTWAVILAEAFVATPFYVVTVEAALRSADTRLEDAARTLRASGWAVFRTVTLPLVRPALAAGAVLCWARALGEFGATITFAGSLEGVTQTIPIAVYTRNEAGDFDGALVLSLVLLAVSVTVLVGLRDRWLRST